MNGLRKIGDWRKVERLIGAISKEMKASREIALKRIGLKLEGTAKLHMSNQDLGWVSLAPETMAAKLRKGYSNNVLVASSDYFQAITSFIPPGDGVVYAGKGLSWQI